MKNIISLGWGVQSFALAAMSAKGLLPKAIAIHADTLHECSDTYRFAKFWTPWLLERGVEVVTVKHTARQGPVDEWGGLFIPAFTDSPSQTGGQLRRQCTHRWKIAPIRRYLRERWPGEKFNMWLGITLDEAQRMRPSGVQYIKNIWPFLNEEMMPDGIFWRREDARQWLMGEGLEIPPRSACYFCPYRSRSEWREMKGANVDDWRNAVNFDAAIRFKRPPFSLYLHRSRIPLDTVDFSSPEDRGQLSLWDDECQGMCGI